MFEFPQLRGKHHTEVVIVGAGITGALICDELTAHGHQVTMVEQRDVAWGSTAASTALLQYEIDTPLTELTELYGAEHALLAYRACEQAITDIARLARAVRDVDFATAESLFYASSEADVEQVEREFEARRDAGFSVELLSRKDLELAYGLQAPVGILSATAARIDPYRMTWRLLARQERKGVHIFDRTGVDSIEVDDKRVTLHLNTGGQIVAKHVVMAAGYSNQTWIKPEVAKNRSSYAFITDPLDALILGKLSETLVWESAHPYIYLRTTGEGRLLVGGEDDSIDIPLKRDASVAAKTKRLREKLLLAFPRLDVEPVFAWAGTFAETEDGLPYFGPHRDYGPLVHFAMAYGGNGITYSSIGAKIIRCAIEGESHTLSELFSFGRERFRRTPRVTESLGHKLLDVLPDAVREALSFGG